MIIHQAFYENQKDSIALALHEANNRLESRIKNHYLYQSQLSDNMVELLKKYYESEIELLDDEIEAEYQIFIHAGEKAFLLYNM